MRHLNTPIDLKKVKQIQTALYKISEATLKSSTLEELFRSIHEIIRELLPAQNLYFALHEPTSDTLTFPYLVDEFDYYPARKSGRGLTEYVIRTGEPLSAPPPVLDELVDRGLVERLGTPAVDWFGVPLIARGKVFGVVAVQSYTEGVRFGEAERNILTFISTQVAMAVERKQAQEALQLSQDRYRDFVQRIAEGVWRTEMAEKMPVTLPVEAQIEHMYAHSVVAECNNAMAQMFGVGSAEELIGVPVRDLHPLNAENIEFRRKYIENNYSIRDYELKEKDRFGQTKYFLCSAVGLVKDGYLIGIWGTQRDITEKKVSEDALRTSEERYRLLFERNLAGVFRASSEGIILDCNPSLARMLGFSRPEDVLSFSFGDFYARKEERESFLFRLREHRALTNVEAEFSRQDGSPLWVLMNVTLLPGAGASFFMEGTLIDITDRKSAEEQVAYQAYHDALTGLPNRVLFRDRLNQALAHTQRHKMGLAVLFLDLDHFKLINDTLGHSIGDWLLKEVADRLKKAVREGDTVARLGGDEFTILLPEVSRSEDAAHVSQKILDVISSPLRWDNHDVYVTTSVGISLSPGDGTDSETLIKCADNAMYRAKELGRNNYQMWSPDLNTRVQNRLSLERSLRRAVERREFVLHYQPQFNLRTGKITGVEALLRWERPGSGLCYPKDFIPIAEETRLIVPIGEWLLPEACRQMKRWQQQEGFENLRLSVNLSAMQFQSKNLVAYFDQVLRETGFNPEQLVIELTETVAMLNVDLTMAVLHTMKRSGIKIALDDFGMGYSSLSYLKHFPIDIIKIDPSFVRDVGAGKQPEALVRAVIRLGHSLKQIIIAEGVETEVQREFLLEEGCHEVQGFLFSPPLPPDEIWPFKNLWGQTGTI